ncbi:ABC transporter permease [Anaerolineaceae bacterium oral taxon 439]|nr:ABC transporter permease [Anaerolineaceae bacterium oral taxon 439]
MKSMIKKLTAKREASVALITVLAALITGLFQPKFFSISNLRSLAIGLSTDGILAIALTIVLVLGGIELSVGSVMALSCVLVGWTFLITDNILFGIIASLTVGIGIGLFNGLMISKLDLPPFIVTLGMQSLAKGAAYIFTEGSPLSMGGLPQWFRTLGRGSVFNIPIIFIIFMVLAVIFDLLMKNITTFRMIFYVGSNENAAKLSGINVSEVKVGVYMLSALLATLTGILSLSRFNVATPTLGTMAETRAISAAVIGGTSMAGGVGTVVGTVLGVVLLNIINNALVMLNVSVYWQDFVTGAILILAVTLDYVSHRKK